MDIHLDVMLVKGHSRTLKKIEYSAKNLWHICSVDPLKPLAPIQPIWNPVESMSPLIPKGEERFRKQGRIQNWTRGASNPIYCAFHVRRCNELDTPQIVSLHYCLQ